jgi:hypothetical protein
LGFSFIASKDFILSSLTISLHQQFISDLTLRVFDSHNRGDGQGKRAHPADHQACQHPPELNPKRIGYRTSDQQP